ncbi:MAG: hypothetical protein GY750_17245 [Lentisphaerae bacterium]|nr:hypothetical protein [Lentisphaerota bacterium]MCP4103144.1 hypothetical protein [Lentisphaerota bacterium]
MMKREILTCLTNSFNGFSNIIIPDNITVVVYDLKNNSHTPELAAEIAMTNMKNRHLPLNEGLAQYSYQNNTSILYDVYQAGQNAPNLVFGYSNSERNKAIEKSQSFMEILDEKIPYLRVEKQWTSLEDLIEQVQDYNVKYDFYNDSTEIHVIGQRDYVYDSSSSAKEELSLFDYKFFYNAISSKYNKSEQQKLQDAFLDLKKMAELYRASRSFELGDKQQERWETLMLNLYLAIDHFRFVREFQDMQKLPSIKAIKNFEAVTENFVYLTSILENEYSSQGWDVADDVNDFYAKTLFVKEYCLANFIATRTPQPLNT